RRSQKLTFLAAGGRVVEARQRVHDAMLEARGLLRHAYGDELHDVQWFDAPDLAARSRDLAAGRTELPVTEGALIDGRVVGAVGPIALVDDDAGRFLLDLGELVGRRVDPEPPARLRRPTVQLGLFA
ncbi:MAG: hypothetical protein KC656_16900, partial [Myxococcales bacterium]|nr:hypothetical protein [Myxococcales bacterium]